MSATERRSLFAGLATLAAAAIVLELGLARVTAVVLGAEAAGAVALVALAAGAAGAFGAAKAGRDAEPTRGLALLAQAAAALAVVAIITALHVSDSKVAPPAAEIAALGGRSVHEALLLAVCAALPFGLIGAAGAASLRAASRMLGRASFAWLGGSAAGYLVAVLSVRAGAPRAVLVAAVLLSLASVAFTIAEHRAAGVAEGSPGERAPSTRAVSLAATAVLGSAVLLAGDVGAPWLKLRVARIGLPDKDEAVVWSELGLVTAERPVVGVSALRVDGVRRGALIDAKGSPPGEPEDLAFAFCPDRGPTLVIDPAGGGRTARAALKAGQKDVACVVGSPALAAEVLAGGLAAFGVTLRDDARVRAWVGDGRGDVRRAEPGLRLLVVSAANVAEIAPLTWPAAGSGAALADAALTTREALAEDLAHLAQDGALVVRTAPDPERLAVALTAALRSTGVADPTAHMFACASKDAAAVLAKKTALTQPDLRALRAHCRQSKLTELLAPDQPRSDLARRLAGEPPGAQPTAAPPASAPHPTAPAASASAAPAPSPPVRLADVPTDDRPFAAAAPAALAALASTPGERVPFVAGAVALLALLGAITRVHARAAAPGSSIAAAGAARAAAAAGLFGVGLAGLEIALARHLAAGLGHPTYVLLLVLPVLYAGLGAGALLTERLCSRTAAPLAVRLAIGAAVVILLAGPSLGPLARWMGGRDTAVRLAASLALLAVVAPPIGAVLPLLVRVAAAERAGGAAVAFGLYLLGRMAGVALGALLVVHVGFAALAAVAAASLGLAAAVVPGGTQEGTRARAAGVLRGEGLPR